MSAATTHVIGAGLAGLACATRLAEAGGRVVLYEATDQAGGRCRSYRDRALDRLLDNGNHLILGGNPETFRYLDRIGGRCGLSEVAPAALAFLDLADGRRWTLRPGRGPLPLWLLDRERRVPDSGLLAHLALLRLAAARVDTTVCAALDLGSPLGRRLWRPLAVSILNTPPEQASAKLLWTVFQRTLLRGEAACRPCIARAGLSQALVHPALALLEERGAAIRWQHRIRGLEIVDGRVGALHLAGESLPLGAGDRVVVAVPADAAEQLLPGLPVPNRFHAILNAHFRLPAQASTDIPVLGLVGGTAEWLFLREDVASVTVSAADGLLELPSEDLADRLWADVAAALGLSGPRPPLRMIKEKRATFAATPAQLARRPQARTDIGNLILAGDWTDTGLPATIEGAVQSGHRAADLIMAENCP